MPCFLAGATQAQVMARTLGVPFYAFSHQQGHIAAALFSSGHMELMDTPHLAWHLSGGTTELLHVVPDGRNVRAERIGGTTDISAGQLIDRTGKLLGLDFPAGKQLDALSRTAGGGGEGLPREGQRPELLAFGRAGIRSRRFTGRTRRRRRRPLRCTA